MYRRLLSSNTHDIGHDYFLQSLEEIQVLPPNYEGPPPCKKQRWNAYHHSQITHHEISTTTNFHNHHSAESRQRGRVHPAHIPLTKSNESTKPVNVTNDGKDDWDDNPALKPKEIPFLCEPGVNIPTSKHTTPYDVFCMFFSGKFFKMICRNTNQYASRLKRSAAVYVSKHSTANSWAKVTTTELKSFFAILFRMGFVRKPHISLYWSSDEVFRERFSPSLMTYERFNGILKMLHFAESDRENNSEPLLEIQPIMDHFRKKFKMVVSPQREAYVHKQSVEFRGFEKPTKVQGREWGVNILELRECSSDYCFDFNVTLTPTEADNGSQVLEAMQEHLNKGYHLYMDDKHTSPALFNSLCKNGTRAVGLCDRNLLPTKFNRQKLKKGDVVACRKDELLALKWKDQKDQAFLSTVHDNSSKVVEVYCRYGTMKRSKPSVVQDYTTNIPKHRNDDLLTYQSFFPKTLKWWKKLFFHLVNLGIENSFKAYNVIAVKNGQAKMVMLDFIITITESLSLTVAEETKQSHFKRPRKPKKHRLQGDHYVMKSPRRMCLVCSQHESFRKKNQGRVRTSKKNTNYCCETCNVPLCLVPCFEHYHTVKDYGKPPEYN